MVCPTCTHYVISPSVKEILLSLQVREALSLTECKLVGLSKQFAQQTLAIRFCTGPILAATL